MECTCKDWKENIHKLNAGFGIMSVHGLGGYSGKQFSFCGWCGKKLKEENPGLSVNVNENIKSKEKIGG